MVVARKYQVVGTVGIIVFGLLLVALGLMFTGGQVQLPMPGPVPPGVDIHLLNMVAGIVAVLTGIGVFFMGGYAALLVTENIDPKLKKGIEYALAIIPGVLTASWLSTFIFGKWPPAILIIVVMIVGIPVWRLIDENYINAAPSKPT